MPVPVGAAATFYAVRKEYKLAIRDARFQFWTATRQTDRAAAWKQLFKATKPVAKPALPDFGSGSEFSDNCHALGTEFFPNTIDNLLALPQN